ncbi:hypothetical protein Pcinc_020435 [Petrolisthes cinctipes]|uniref:Uncharacterized protein n=1 Tax=Petrolisthes cinctipes TaxID=88211 RepID=A0AAE1KLC8_PETCI|nr:hypothetical protein Pcinc_020435 [Petrolisthes cinctipes]
MRHRRQQRSQWQQEQSQARQHSIDKLSHILEQQPPVPCGPDQRHGDEDTMQLQVYKVFAYKTPKSL